MRTILLMLMLFLTIVSLPTASGQLSTEPPAPKPSAAVQKLLDDANKALQSQQPEEALKAIDNCWVYLTDHRSRTHYQTLRRGGYPLGSGGMESANKFICHVRLKRSGAWCYEASSNQILALRCAKYNGTFDHVFTRAQHQKADV